MTLKALRESLVAENIGVYILPRTDEHQSEYLCDEDQRLAFLSGFTGSSGIALVSQADAFVWTDSRYFIQAVKELKEGWELKKLKTGEPQWLEVVTKTYPKGTVVGIDGRLISATTGQRYLKTLEQSDMILKIMNTNLVDVHWDSRPKSSASDIFLHESWAGIPAIEKIKWVQSNIKQLKGNGCLITDLSSICWILNVRSSEIPYNPFMKGILLLQPEGTDPHTLYLPVHHPNLISQSEELKQHLKSLNVQLKPYPLADLPDKLLTQKSELNFLIYSGLKDPIQWKGIGIYRAKRNQKEQDGFRQAHIRDGVAMARFWSWRSKQQKVGEYEAAMYLDSLRCQENYCKGISFTTISSGGPNGAIVHYHPQKQNDFITTNDMVLLVDSGGQYLDGTTDVTRCFHFGTPTSEERDSFTRVLLGNLDIERLTWPKTTTLTGGMIDTFARRHLWAAKKDYGHGTGHGVGYFQGVHEGPVGISAGYTVNFEPGMIVSNEPGYYQDGKYGIRIQNLIMAKEEGEWRYFQNLTLCPYDLNLIDRSLLTQRDIDYINSYHMRCRQTLSPLLQKYPQALEWLQHSTRPF